MNIAIYQPRASYYVGGGEIVPLEQARYLAKRGHRVTIVTTRGGNPESDYFKRFKTENPRIHIVYIAVPKSLQWIYHEEPGKRWLRWDLESLCIGDLTREYFEHHRFNIIAVHNVLDMLAVPIGQRSVLHLHGYPPAINYMQELCMILPTKITADSKFIKEKWLHLMSVKEIVVASNGVDSDHFVPGTQDQKQFDILYVGRLITTKGVQYLIDAVSLLKQQGVCPLVAIAGKGPDAAALRAQSNKQGVSDQISFLGYVDDHKLVELYQAARMAVAPSYDREGILTTMLEAASCGVAVITTTACSMKEFLDHKKNGLLVRPQNSRAIGSAISFLLKNPLLLQKMGNAARSKIVRQWSWDKKIITIEHIYEATYRRG